MAKPDDESQRTGPSDFVLCRDRHCPRRGRHSGLHRMGDMIIRGFIAHNRESGAYTLTDSGRATLGAVAIPKKPQTARSKRGNVPPLQ
jgi:hypothetical protein